MALDVTINLNDELEAELAAQTAEANALIVPPAQTLSPAQFLRRDVRERLILAAQQRADSEKLGLRSAYKQATAQEQATIDAILDKYR